MKKVSLVFLAVLTVCISKYANAQNSKVVFSNEWLKFTNVTEQAKWKFNGELVQFGQDTITVNTNKLELDTILFQRTPNDTWKKSLAKLKSDNIYIIRPIPCRDYDLVDPNNEIATRTAAFYVSNIDSNSTSKIVGHVGWNYKELENEKFSDSVLVGQSLNCGNSRVAISIESINGKVITSDLDGEVDGTKLFSLNYQYLHNEQLIVMYDANSKQASIFLDSIPEQFLPDSANRIEINPVYPGGTEVMNRFISDNLNYPKSAFNDKVTGRVYVGFTVGRNGYVKDVKIYRGVREDLNNEAMRIIQSMPRWKPGTINGIPADVDFTIPLTFHLTGRKKKNKK